MTYTRQKAVIGHLRIGIAFAVAAMLSGCAAESATETAPFDVVAGVEQITVTHAEPHAHLTLVSPEGRRMVTLIADEFGQAHFAYIPFDHQVLKTGEDGDTPSFKEGSTLAPGSGYLVRDETKSPWQVSKKIRVLAKGDVRDSSFYKDQVLHEGMNYLVMRDGVTLSATVWFPDSFIWGPPPWPTVVNYSGYSPSDPDHPPPGALMAQQFGYVGIGVNMRGTGCSGGVFDVFNPAQTADGYDMVEIIAAQPWVKHNKIGLVGLSYPGISQLYVASTQPPSLAAIAPLSVIEDPWRQQWPGGVYNSGFTKNWLEERDKQAKPSGNSWVRKRIIEGDSFCKNNQKLRHQNIDFEVFGHSLNYYQDDAEARRLTNLIPAIDVPVFLTGAWQDEQTGSRFATMLDNFDSAPVKRFTMFNGRHPDGYTPLTMSRWLEFLEFYVNKEIPFLHPVVRFIGPSLFRSIFGVSGLRFEGNRFTDLDVEQYDVALTRYENEPDVRILFESGNAPNLVPEAPAYRYETHYEAWPPPAKTRTFYLGPDETLLDAPPTTNGVDTYEHDNDAGDISYLIEEDLWQHTNDWPVPQQGFNLSYLSAPLANDMLIVGNGGYATLWFASEATQANVEINLLEVFADGTEFLVQSGVFNVAHRGGVDPVHSQEFLLEYTYREADAAPLTPGEFVEVNIPLRPFSHPFRKGTRVRLMINTPGRDSPYWEYENPTYEGKRVFHQVARSPGQNMASALVLPEVTAIDIPDDQPPCPSLRGVVCRPFVNINNIEVP